MTKYALFCRPAYRKACMAGVVFTFGACFDSPRPFVGVVEVTATRTRMVLGEEIHASATALSMEGIVIADVTESLYSKNDTILRVGSITEQGVVVTAVGAGSTQLAAVAGGIAEEVVIDVECPDTQGPKMHQGLIKESEVWRAVDGPHRIVGDIVVAGTESCDEGTAGCICKNDTDECEKPIEVKIESCSVVQVAAGVSVRVGNGGPGSLQVLGGVESEGGEQPGFVTFEPDVAGATAGYWGGLVLDNRAQRKDTTVLRGVKIRGAGGGVEQAAIATAGGVDSNTRPQLFAVSIEGSGGYGVKLGEFGSLSRDSGQIVVTEARDAPWLSHPNAVATIPLSSKHTNNGMSAFVVTGGLIRRSSTWSLTSLPYKIGGVVSVSGDPAYPPVLRIVKGVEVRFEKGAGLEVGMVPNQSATIRIGPIPRMTETAKIVLTSAAPEPAAGDWIGLVIGPYVSTTTVGAIRNAEFRYAGAPSGLIGTDGDWENPDNGALVLMTSILTMPIEGVRVHDSAGYAVVHGYSGNAPTSIAKRNPDLNKDADSFAYGVESLPNPLKLTSEDISKKTMTGDLDCSFLCVSWDTPTKSPRFQWSYRFEPTGKDAVEGYALALWGEDPDRSDSRTPLWLIHDIEKETHSIPRDVRGAPSWTGRTAIPYTQYEGIPSAPSACKEAKDKCVNKEGLLKTQGCKVYYQQCVVNLTFTLYALGVQSLEVDTTTAQTVSTDLQSNLLGLSHLDCICEKAVDE